MLGVDRNASYIKVTQAWERLAVTKFDPHIKHTNKELNTFLKWRDAGEWLLMDEWVRAIYNMRLEQFERLKAAGLREGHDGYTKEFFVYESDEVESKEIDSDEFDSETDSEDSPPSKYPKGACDRGKYHPDSCFPGRCG
jgi:hypothetical protein